VKRKGHRSLRRRNRSLDRLEHVELDGLAVPGPKWKPLPTTWTGNAVTFESSRLSTMVTLR